MARLFPQAGVTVVQQVANHVRERIANEQLKRGAPLPSYRELANELEVACWTVKRGIDELVAEGVVLPQQGRGVFVAKELSGAPRALRNLGIVFPSTRSSLFRAHYLTDIMRGVTIYENHCPRLHLFSLHQDGLIPPAQLVEWAVDGVILISVENDDYLHVFARHRIPAVVADYRSPDVPLDFVACDNRGAARRIVSHLAALGHRQVTYIDTDSKSEVVKADTDPTTILVRDSSDVRERRAESLQAMDDAGLRAEVWTQPVGMKPPEWMATVMGRLDDLWSGPDRPTVLLLGNNYSAERLVDALARRGRRVPEDLSVAAVASDSDVRLTGQALTACRFDFVGMGRQAFDLLVQRCRNRGLKKACEHRIGFEFIEGQTVGRVGPA